MLDELSLTHPIKAAEIHVQFMDALPDLVTVEQWCDLFEILCWKTEKAGCWPHEGQGAA